MISQKYILYVMLDAAFIIIGYILQIIYIYGSLVITNN